MRESKIERSLIDTVRKYDGIAYKFVSPGVCGVPDRLCLYPVPVMYRDIIAKYIRFVELKAPGKKQSPRQKRESDKIRAMGFVVDVVDHA